MYALASQLHNLPVVSLQTGQAVGAVRRPIIESSNLEVMALYCQTDKSHNTDEVVLMRDIRQLASDCVIIDSVEEIEEVHEIVRLREVAEKDFNPLQKAVVNESGHRLGKVEDYTINIHSSMIQKLYVQQPLWRSILFSNLVIDRTQIIDVTPRHFMVRDASVKQLLPQHKSIPQGTKHN